MNLPQDVAACVCSSTGNPHNLCFGNNGFQEKGIQVKFTAKNNEELKSIVLDGCLLTNQKQKRCDGLFFFRKGNRVYIILVELKSIRNIDDAFAQLTYVKYESQEYKDLCEHIKDQNGKEPIERYFVITLGTGRGTLSSQKVRGIRIRVVVQTKTTKSAAPDLRKYVLNKKPRG